MNKSIPCPECRKEGKDNKGNNMTIYEDGHGYCHARGHKLNIEIKNTASFIIDTQKGILERGISKEVCQRIDLYSGTYDEKDAYLFMYDLGLKIRFKNEKKYLWIDGNASDCQMYGLNKCHDFNRVLIITEGEFDAAACWEAGYQACSLRSGAKDVEKALLHDLDKLKKFKEIWIFFDNDEEGTKATQKALVILKGLLIRVILFNNYKDANEILMIDKLKDLLAHYEQKNDKREGLVFGNELDFNSLMASPVKSLEFPWPKLTESMGGLDYGCLYLVLAGVGIGKTTVMNELGGYYYNKGLKVAHLFYEDGNEDTAALRLVSNDHNVKVGKLRRNRQLLSEEQWNSSKDKLTENICFIKKGALKTSDKLFDWLDYLVTNKHYDIIILDHISYIIGRSNISKNGERRDIDELLYKLQDFVNSNKVILIGVSHITESKKEKGWDEGEIPGLYSGRGSKALAQIPDGIIGLSRDMKNEFNQSIINIYNLKNRWDGRLGKMDSLIYYDDIGRLELYK